MRKWWLFSIFYLLVLFAPLLLGLVLPDAQRGPARPWRDELAAGLGMLAFAVVLMEFVLLGRFRPVSRTLGSDLAMQAHQLLARSALVFVLLHPVLYSLWGRRHLPWDETFAQALRVEAHLWGLITGILALGSLLALVMLAVYRSPTAGYERWRLGHSALALATLGLGLHHTLELGRYAQLPAVRMYWWGLALLALLAWLSVYVLRPWLQARRPMRLQRIAPLAYRIWEVEIAPEDGRPYPFHPGQFVWLKVGTLAPHQDHPFSISSAPASDGTMRFVIKEAGDFTMALSQVPIGTRVYVDGPHGNFRLPPGQAPIVMLAGGIGIAPFLGLLADCAARGERRALRLIYADRNPAQMVDVTKLCELPRLADFAQLRMVEAPPPGWDGLVGRLDAEGLSQVLDRPEVAPLLSQADFMVCGPVGMMEAVETALTARGVPLQRIHAEHFQYHFSGRSPRVQRLRRGWLLGSGGALLLAALLAALG